MHTARRSSRSIPTEFILCRPWTRRLVAWGMAKKRGGAPRLLSTNCRKLWRRSCHPESKIDMLMKTETLKDSLDKYRSKIAGSARNRAAAYELALASGRSYNPGDQISYYIKATRKKVPAYEAAKLASDFDTQNRDENVDYYVAKLDELMKKFSSVSTTPSAAKQQTLAL